MDETVEEYKNSQWVVEFWRGDDNNLLLNREAKEILEKILSGPTADIPQFVRICGEVIAVNNIARIRRSANW